MKPIHRGLVDKIIESLIAGSSNSKALRDMVAKFDDVSVPELVAEYEEEIANMKKQLTILQEWRKHA